MTIILYQNPTPNSNEIRYLQKVVNVSDRGNTYEIRFLNGQIFNYDKTSFYKMEILKD